MNFRHILVCWQGNVMQCHCWAMLVTWNLPPQHCCYLALVYSLVKLQNACVLSEWLAYPDHNHIILLHSLNYYTIRAQWCSFGMKICFTDGNFVTSVWIPFHTVMCKWEADLLDAVCMMMEGNTQCCISVLAVFIRTLTGLLSANNSHWFFSCMSLFS